MLGDKSNVTQSQSAHCFDSRIGCQPIERVSHPSMNASLRPASYPAPFSTSLMQLAY
jgi:hypothetical protein